jgi:uncharacterized protein with PIN domain
MEELMSEEMIRCPKCGGQKVIPYASRHATVHTVIITGSADEIIMCNECFGFGWVSRDIVVMVGKTRKVERRVKSG